MPYCSSRAVSHLSHIRSYVSTTSQQDCSTTWLSRFFSLVQSLGSISMSESSRNAKQIAQETLSLRVTRSQTFCEQKVIKIPKTFCCFGKTSYLCHIVNTYPNIMANKKQIRRQEKSLPKETLVESIGGERHGAVASNASAKNLNSSGSERLNHSALTHSYSVEKTSSFFNALQFFCL